MPFFLLRKFFIIFTAMNIIMLGSAGGNPVPQTICLSNSPSELELFHSVYVSQNGFRKQILIVCKFVSKSSAKFIIMNIIIFAIHRMPYSGF